MKAECIPVCYFMKNGNKTLNYPKRKIGAVQSVHPLVCLFVCLSITFFCITISYIDYSVIYKAITL